MRAFIGCCLALFVALVGLHCSKEGTQAEALESGASAKAGSSKKSKAGKDLSPGKVKLAPDTLTPTEKYRRKAITAEAIYNLDKIYKGSAVYYATPHVMDTGQKVPCQFPTTTECTPKGSPCDHPGKRYPHNPAIWDTPTWSSLNFQVNDAHYFKYCIKSAGELSKAHFEVSAHADLDCDGTWSTFTRKAKGDPQATFAECSLVGSYLEIDNELE